MRVSVQVIPHSNGPPRVEARFALNPEQDIKAHFKRLSWKERRALQREALGGQPAPDRSRAAVVTAYCRWQLGHWATQPWMAIPIFAVIYAGSLLIDTDYPWAAAVGGSIGYGLMQIRNRRRFAQSVAVNQPIAEGAGPGGLPPPPPGADPS